MNQSGINFAKWERRRVALANHLHRMMFGPQAEPVRLEPSGPGTMACKGRAVETDDDGPQLRFRNMARAAREIGVTHAVFYDHIKRGLKINGRRWRFCDGRQGRAEP